MIDQYGDEALKQKYVPSLTKFDLFSSYCLTEPDSGSDAIAMKTTAVDNGKGEFVLNGSKAFISGAGASDVYIIMCKTGPKEVSCIVVDKDAPGLSFGKNEIKVKMIGYLIEFSLDGIVNLPNLSLWRTVESPPPIL